MNNFCNSCKHRKIPKILKVKLNEYYYPYFVFCPISDNQIFGCRIKYLDVEWDNFYKYLLERDLLTKNEINNLKKIGWKTA